MAPTFRYRYVDRGTRFTGDPKLRGAENVAESPSILFANELACDVGETCWGPSEPLAIIDHHLSHEVPFPSASAAVLHKAPLICEKFGGVDNVIWLVTHREPDFDAFCSMYLARWLVGHPDFTASTQRYGLHPDAWLDMREGGKIDWFSPDLNGIPLEDRWLLKLASYASRLEMRRPILVQRERSLRSILISAMKRGRDYVSASSGATEFFDEVRSILQARQLNPAVDSVLEGSENFAAELAMLDREAVAYEHDIQRARKSMVYLPESEAPSPDFFEHRKKPVQASGPEASAEHLLLADSFRIPTDGIYLRDPECALFREWAWLDLENSALRAGFEFTAIAYSNRRPTGQGNTSEYVISIDPERANGRHLYTVWSRLETEEVEALRQQRNFAMPGGGVPNVEARSGTLEAVLSDPWSGGDSHSSTFVSTPDRGTLIGPAGTRSDLLDDPVAEAVRTELESPIYTAASSIAGPEVTVVDLAATKDTQDLEPGEFHLSSAQEIPVPREKHFRLVTIGLREDVPIAAGEVSADRLIRQIGETLWRLLYPDLPVTLPADFESRLVVRSDSVGVWSERGIAIAQKHGSLLAASSGIHDGNDVRGFREMVSLIRDIDQFAEECKSLGTDSELSDRRGQRVLESNTLLQACAEEGDDLVRRALEVQHALTLPGYDLLGRFHGAIGFDQLAARLRDLNRATSEHLARSEAAAEARRLEKQANDFAVVEQKLRWLEGLLLGLIALDIVGVALRSVTLGTALQHVLVLFAAPAILTITLLTLRPWKRKRGSQTGATSFAWIVALAVLVWAVSWISLILQFRNS